MVEIKKQIQEWGIVPKNARVEVLNYSHQS